MELAQLNYDVADVYGALLSSIERRVNSLDQHGLVRNYAIAGATPSHIKGWLYNNSDRAGLELVLSHIAPGTRGNMIGLPRFDELGGCIEFGNFLPTRKRTFEHGDPVVKQLERVSDRCVYAFALLWETGPERLHCRFYFPQRLATLTLQLLHEMQQVFGAQSVLGLNELTAPAGGNRRGRPAETQTRERIHRLAESGKSTAEIAEIEHLTISGARNYLEPLRKRKRGH